MNPPSNARGYRFDPWPRKILQALGQLSLYNRTTKPSKSPCSTRRETTTMKSLHTANTATPTTPHLLLTATRESPHTATKTQNSQK